MRTKGIGPNNLGMSKSSPANMMPSPAKKDPPLTPEEREAKNKIDAAANANNKNNTKRNQADIVAEAQRSSDGSENYVRSNIAGRRGVIQKFESEGVRPVGKTQFAKERVVANAKVNNRNRRLGKETVVETEKYFSGDATVKNKKAPKIITKSPKMKLR